MLKKLALLGIVGFAALVIAGAAQAAKPSVQLSHELFNGGGDFVVEYTVQSQGGGNMDLAVSHQCFSDGELVQSWTNRVYWSGKGKDKAGQWNIQVEAGNECVAVAVDVDQIADSSDPATRTASGYVEVSDPLRYTVE